MINYYGNVITWTPTLDNSSQPKYKQIADAMEKDIKSGKLLPGNKLPPQRVIANYLEVNHGTVTKAYQLCEEKGLIRGTIGKGTYVSSNAGIPLDMLTDHKDNGIISLGMALPLYEINPAIEAALSEISSQIDYSEALKYCPSEGHLKHRYIASEWLRDYLIDSHPDNIIVTAGTQNALAIVLITLFDKGDRVIVDEYTYAGLKSLSSYLGIILIPVSGDHLGTNVEELEQICKRESPKGIYIVSDCNNPTTISLSINKRMQIAHIIETYNLILIEDAACSFTLAEKLPPICSFVPNHGIYIHGTSKSLNPSFRISYLVSPPKYTHKLQKGINNITWMASIYSAEIMSLLQVSKLFDQIVSQKLDILKNRNLCYDQILSEYNSIPAESTLYRYLKLPANWNDIDIERKAFDAGIQVFSANRFYAGTTIKYNALRVSISSPDNMSDLKDGLIILKDILDNYEGYDQPII